jgi:hypothetical protein
MWFAVGGIFFAEPQINRRPFLFWMAQLSVEITMGRINRRTGDAAARRLFPQRA